MPKDAEGRAICHSVEIGAAWRTPAPHGVNYGELLSWLTMEGLMATVVTLDASPLNVLRYMRGAIVDARIAYPEVLHVEIKDSAGELWHLATQDAEWSPSDPAELVGCAVADADIDAETGELRCKLSDGSLLDVKPANPRGGRRPAQLRV